MQSFRSFVENFDPSQPRDKNGQWKAGKKKANVAHALDKIKELGHVGVEWKKPGTLSAAAFSQGKIHINAAHKYWADPVAFNAHNHKIGHLATDDAYHTIYHEIGHALYDPPDNFLNNQERDVIEKHVSKYACMNPKEFVSEVHAGMMAGKTYPAEIMHLFNRYAKKRT